jgi:hypothetical protein
MSTSYLDQAKVGFKTKKESKRERETDRKRERGERERERDCKLIPQATGYPRNPGHFL